MGFVKVLRVLGMFQDGQTLCLPHPLLCSLNIVAPGFGSTLPDIHPGAMLRLVTLRLYSHIISTLPVSWGSRPTVLPALMALDLGRGH